ncbi:bacteriocin immunity protein [Dellaglioa sp. BT-FLS60]
MKKAERIALEEKLTETVYDLILNLETTEDERKILVIFKNHVETGMYFTKAESDLAEALRQLAVRNLKYKVKLSPNVGQLYMDISTNGLFNKNLGWGLIAMSGTRLF